MLRAGWRLKEPGPAPVSRLVAAAIPRKDAVSSAPGAELPRPVSTVHPRVPALFAATTTVLSGVCGFDGGGRLSLWPHRGPGVRPGFPSVLRLGLLHFLDSLDEPVRGVDLGEADEQSESCPHVVIEGLDRLFLGESAPAPHKRQQGGDVGPYWLTGPLVMFIDLAVQVPELARRQVKGP